MSRLPQGGKSRLKRKTKMLLAVSITVVVTLFLTVLFLNLRAHIVWLTTPKSVGHYPDRLRRVSYRDPEDGKVLVFLTNNCELPALVIALLYKLRWPVEWFFKWIKQNLRIKHFFGTSDNAVKTQVWIAVCVYVLAAIVRKELGLEVSLSQMLQIVSFSAFEQVPLAALFAKTATQDNTLNSCNQLMLWQ